MFFLNTNNHLLADTWLGCCFSTGVCVDGRLRRKQVGNWPQAVLVISEPAFSVPVA